MAREPHLRGSAPTGIDRDLHTGWVVGFGASIALLVILGAIVCAVLIVGYRADLARRYPPPSPIPEAHLPVPRKEPQLQVAPRLDMAAYRDQETLLLTSFGWSDRPRGTARIPITRAIELYASGRASPAMTEPPAPGADGGAPPPGGDRP